MKNKMVLSPKDLQPQIEARRQAIQRVVENLEHQIDDTLWKEAPFVKEEVTYSLPNEIPSSICKRVIDDYRSKGWEVRVQRTDPQFNFTNLVFQYESSSE